MGTQCILQVPSHTLRRRVLPTCYTGGHRLRDPDHYGKTRFFLKRRYFNDGQLVAQSNGALERA
jgi:hypothetical protein